MRTPGCSSTVLVLLGALALQSSLAQEAHPRIQEELSRPFCYFLRPSDELGFKDSPEAFQVTHDLALASPFGELQLWSGDPPAMVTERIRTLREGWLPVLEARWTRQGCDYELEAFATPLDLDPRENLIAFIEVTATNRTEAPVQANVGCTFWGSRGQGREELTCPDWWQDRWLEEGTFRRGSFGTAEDFSGTRGGHLLYDLEPDPGWIATGAAAGAAGVTCTRELPPGASSSVCFRVPHVPIHASRTAALEALRGAGHEAYLARVTTFWKDLLARCATFLVPEAKVVDTLRASLVYDLMARDIQEDGSFIQKVSDIHYDGFWVRDGAFFVRAYDLLGLHDIAAETIEHFLLLDPEGQVEAFRGHQPDSWGQSLWVVGAHQRITGDLAFARRIYPAVPPHVAALEEACAADPLGLFPAVGPYSNERLAGHYTGHSLWVLLGLSEAASLADALGATEDLERFRALRATYLERFLQALEKVTGETGGYIPPGLDDPRAGNDWANCSAGVYPFRALPPDHPWVGATLQALRDHKYREGIMTYGPCAQAVREGQQSDPPVEPGRLHHYETFYVTQALLARGAQREALEDLYAILVHTSSTQGGFEWGIEPWGDRDPRHNLPPHGWFAARYIALVRNLLVREEGEALHLASALSPVWVQPGQAIVVENAPTDFGVLSYRLQSQEGGARLTLSGRWVREPASLRLHVPWFLELLESSVDGVVQPTGGAHLDLAPATKEVVLRWRWREHPELSFTAAVRHYLQQRYAPTPSHDPRFLFPGRSLSDADR